MRITTMRSTQRMLLFQVQPLFTVLFPECSPSLGLVSDEDWHSRLAQPVDMTGRSLIAK